MISGRVVRKRSASRSRHRSGDTASGSNGIRESGGALRQQRCHVVGMDRDVCTRGDRVMTANGAAGQDGVDRQRQARALAAATVVGDAIVARRFRASPRLHRTSGPRNLTITLDRVVESIEHLTIRRRLPFSGIGHRNCRVAASAARRELKAWQTPESPKHDASMNHQVNRCKDVSGFS